MKKLTFVFLFITLLFAVVLITRGLNDDNQLSIDNQQEVVSMDSNQEILPSNSICFSYQSEQTKESPYSVTETITFSKITEQEIEGIKKGTQFGPGMSNGYEGVLHGTISGTQAVIVFSYTIEGSIGTEQELYTINDETIIKHRYPLKEIGNLLVPDTNSEKTDIVYIKTTCE